MVGSLGKTGSMGIASRSGVTQNSLPSDSGAGRNVAARAGLTDVLMGRAQKQGLQSQAAWQRGQLMNKNERRPTQTPAVSEHFKLPSWIQVDAHLSYSSKSLGRRVEAIVE